MNFMRRNVGQIIVASAIIDDSIGWIIIAITFGLAQHGTIEVASLARSVLGTLVFLAVSLTIGRRAVSALIRWTNDSFVSELPVVTVIGLQVGGLLAGAVITETIFAWDGVGRWAVQAIQGHDYIVVQSVITIFAFIFLAVNLIVDIAYAYLNPRIRYA